MKNVINKIVTAITDLLKILRINFPIGISIGVLYLILGISDQGQDMLININSTDWGPATLYAALGILALIHWQFPKFFSKEALRFSKFKKIFSAEFHSPTKMSDYNRIVPRLLGIITFLVPAYCVLRLIKKYYLPQPGVNEWFKYLPNPIIFIFSSLLVFGISLHYNWFVKFYEWIKKKKWGKNVFAAICITLALSPVLFWPLNYGLPSDQVYLFFGWSLYAVLFALVTSTRWSIIENTSLNIIRLLFRDKSITKLVWTMAFGCSSFFLFFVIMNAFSKSFQYTHHFTFAIILSGLIFYITIVTLLLYQSARTQKNYFGVAILTIILLVYLNPDYYHRVATEDIKPNTTAIDSLENYIIGWIKQRDAQRLKGTKYPIILVNSYGGGIRAAAWTCLAVNRLDSLTGGEFQRHVFSYSGASGGTIGSSIICANGFNKEFRNIVSYRIKDSLYHSFFTDNDFLTADLVGLLGNDALYSILPYNNFNDRAILQANCWEKAYKKVFNNDTYQQDLFELWNNESAANKYNVPLLFSNSTEVTQGAKGIIAPVVLNDKDFIGDVLIGKLLERMKKTIKLSTAAFLSARFPYVSPAGEIDTIISPIDKEKKYFLDGGAKDNSGAETSYAIAKLFENVFDNDEVKVLKDSFQIICISLKNSNIANIINRGKQKVSQLWAPLNSIVNGGMNGATEKADSINRNKFSCNYYILYPQDTSIKAPGVNIFGCKKSELTTPILPLGWQLSNLAMTFMEKSVNDTSNSQGENKLFSLSKILNEKYFKKMR